MKSTQTNCCQLHQFDEDKVKLYAFIDSQWIYNNYLELNCFYFDTCQYSQQNNNIEGYLMVAMISVQILLSRPIAFQQ